MPRVRLANLLRKQGRFGEQLALLRAGVEDCPASTGLRNDYAYVLATSMDDSLRDGDLALALARQVVREAGKRPAYLDTLACALAEAGRFEDAVRVAEAALASIEKQNAPQATIDGFVERLATLRSGRAVRE